MKTKQFALFLVVALVSLVITSCNKDNLGTPGIIQLNASNGNTLTKSATVSTATGTLVVQSAVVEIQNLQIEENSGNDNDNQQGENNDKDDNGKENEKGGKENDDAEDIFLAGPFVLDISAGTASIDQVEVPAGTYKKVDFDFYAGTENNNNSIVLSGEYTAANGAVIPFEVASDFEATVQLPLTKGISVTSGGAVSVSILFDVNSWLAGLDFENAVQTDGSIYISKTQNLSLYNAFLEAVSQNIEVED